MPPAVRTMSFWLRLTSKQKLSLIFLVVLLLFFPMVYAVSQIQTRLFPRAFSPQPAGYPQITTAVLPLAMLNVPYRTQIDGEDLSSNGTSLTMTVTGLPSGFAYGPCSMTAGGILPTFTPTPTSRITNTPMPTVIRTPTPTFLPTPTPTYITPVPRQGSTKYGVLGDATTPTSTPSTPTPTSRITNTPMPTTVAGLVKISCIVSGMGVKPGSFPISVVLRNSRTGLVASKTLTLDIGSKVVTPTFTPTPKPITNNPPVILTTALQSGRTRVAYSARVEGSGDLVSNLTFSVSGLPDGLKLAGCLRSTGTSGIAFISCGIIGMPTRVGYFRPTFKLNDGHGGITSKTMAVWILPSVGGLPKLEVTVPPRY